ncbi:hypothetical protein K458DRAFT_437678 [Lentithecium fluviatile CBS 122367]|uniref:Uncharacterized protein n=1 Tax=Lentithecium fluviatile CBS 122367 TaxID=1168545 RepID=A0A6G1ID67_9PLEO|nr:hypothetical protein K458DRAFT_437678 [Lentithecium fluviatile CBS 122367]
MAQYNAASVRGHEAVARLLLDKGADVNAQGGDFGNALQAASYGGHELVVRLLLDKGADVNVQGGGFGNALQAASAADTKSMWWAKTVKIWDANSGACIQTLKDHGRGVDSLAL